MSNNGNPSTIILRSVTPGENRYRAFAIQWEPTEPGVHVRVVWGRIGLRRNVRDEQFDSEAAAIKRVEALLKKRLRRGYVLVERSDDFPECPVVKDFPPAPSSAERQRFLFPID